MLLQQFLPAISQISSEYIFQQDSAPSHSALKAIDFLVHKLVNVNRFLKFFHSKVSSTFVMKS